MQYNDNFISKIQEALEFEYSDFFSYRREAFLFKEKIVDGEKLEKEFLYLSDTELRHADILSNKLLELGIEPKWEMKKFYISNSLRETLSHHLETESMMYKFYEDLLVINTDPNFAIIIQGIQQNEKKHFEKIKFLISKIGR